jgi:kynurenine formamidase
MAYPFPYRAEDLSLLLGHGLPCNWPSTFLPSLVIGRHIVRGPEPYRSEAILIDEHTGTHWDAPPHFIPPAITALPNASAVGDTPAEGLPPWQFMGEACVIDVQDLVDGPGPGQSALITRQRVEQWQNENRRLGPGDAVLFFSGYTDKYYRPFPTGRRFLAEPMMGMAPSWPGVDPDCADYLASLKVNLIGTDAPNIGPMSPLAIQTHINGLRQGVILIENLTNLGCLPTIGSVFALLGPKHAGGSGGEARAVAVMDAAACAHIIRSVRQQQVIDLSVLLREDLPVTWPGRGVPDYRMVYRGRTLHTWEQPGGPALVRTHLLDSHTGTHLVPPSYAVPEPRFDMGRLDEITRKALSRFENEFGKIGTSIATTDRIPVSHLCGPARIVDVHHLAGTAGAGQSPLISVSDVQRHEDQFGAIQANEIVVFCSGYTDRFFQPLPLGNRCMEMPLNGKAEGWPAPGPETIFYLNEKGVRCVATDSPRMGGAEPVQAMRTYWAGGSKGMSFIEFLMNVGLLPKVGAFLLFAPIKTKGTHGGYGRALATF